MDTRAVVLKSFEDRRRKYRREFNLARANFSEDAVHDLRVATRRLLALLALIHILAPEPDLKPLRKALKSQLDGLDQLRDSQVMLGEVKARASELSGLEPMRQELEIRVEKLLVRAQRSLGALTFVSTSNLNSRLLGLREYLSSQPQLGDPLAAADSAYAEVMHRYKTVDPADPASFHLLRVPFKKFRYTVEVVQPLVPSLEKAALTNLSNYQTLLGNVQDARVFLEALQHFAGEDITLPIVADGFPRIEDMPSAPGNEIMTPTDGIMTDTAVIEDRVAIEDTQTQPSIETAHHFYTKRLNDAVSEAFSSLANVESFWRSSPEQPFPWEKPT